MPCQLSTRVGTIVGKGPREESALIEIGPPPPPQGERGGRV